MDYLLKTLVLQNETISYYLKDNQAKKTILFIHGYNSSSDFAAPLFKLNQNFNLIVLNLPGSLLLSNPQQILTLDLFQRIVNEFISEHIQSRHLILLGHSLGGGTVSFLSQHPKVKQVIYLSTIHPRMHHSTSWKQLQTFYAKPDHFGQVKSYLVQKPELDEIFDQTTLFAHLTKAYLLNLEFVTKELKFAYLKSLNKKPLFIIGQKDYVIETQYFNDFVRKDLNQSLVVIKDVSHSPIKEVPEQMNQILNEQIKFKRRFWPFKLVKH